MTVKKIILTFLSLASLTATAQHVTVVFTRGAQNIYLCGYNQFYLRGDGENIRDVWVTTDNGVIDSNYESLKIKPDRTGPSTIYVHQKVKKGVSIVTDSLRFIVKRLPAGKARLGTCYGGKMHSSSIRIQESVFVPARYDISSFCKDPGGTVGRFTLLAYRDNAEIFRHQCSGPFDEGTKHFLEGVRRGDKLIFTNITQIDCDGTHVRLPEFGIIVD